MTLLIVLAIFAIQPLAFIVVLTVSTVLDLCDRVFKAPVPGTTAPPKPDDTLVTNLKAKKDESAIQQITSPVYPLDICIFLHPQGY